MFYMNYAEDLKNKLQKYKKDDIILTPHAEIRLNQRNISKNDIIKNITNPTRLYYAEKQIARGKEERYNCFFKLSKSQDHRYIIILNRKCIICTVIKIKTRWQKRYTKNKKTKHN
jgi:hypothetical protein